MPGVEGRVTADLLASRGARVMAVACSENELQTLGLMRSVAQDAGPHSVTSNAVLPGWVRTPMAEISAEVDAAQRGITPDEVWAERAARSQRPMIIHS